MIDVRRELVDTIKKQMVADMHMEMSDEEAQKRLWLAVESALTADENKMPCGKLAKCLAAASAIAIRELDSEMLH